jgi:hypothetical protein
MSDIGFCCEQMETAINSPEIPLNFNAKFREFGIAILDGGSSVLEITHCPWCAKKLPGSLRQKWFDELEKRGIDPATGAIPPEFTDARWYAGKDI